MKRLLSFFLVFVMVAGLLPMTVDAEALPKLANPSELAWGDTGLISFNPNEPTQGVYTIKIYKEGDEFPSVIEEHWTSTSYNLDYIEFSTFCEADLDSGNYYFTITSEGDGTSYCDSEEIRSDVWTYTKPSQKLGSCTNPSWNWPYVNILLPTNLNYAGGFFTQFFFSETIEGTPYEAGAYITNYVSNETTNFGSVYDEIIQRYGNGYYYFKVRLLSSDITTICNGEWSELSPAYYLGDAIESVSSQLSNTVSNSANMSAEEIRTAVQSVETTELKAAMLADQTNSGTVANIVALETVVGGAASVQVSQEASAFDASKVSIIGANLNNAASATDPITLVLDKPQKDHVLDTMYNNSVAVKFSMDLKNVADSKNLEVPVKITLPIPININPDFLVILHYHADGIVEELQPYISGGYASFVLTSFSDFVITEYASEENPTEPPITEPPATEPPVVLPTITGTYTTDLVMPAADLGVSAPDSVLRATLTFTEDGKATATWEAVDLTAFKVFFHDMFVSSYYAMAYGAGITDIQQIEQFCIDSTGLSVSAYMDTIVTDEAMKAAFTPPSTQGTYRYAPENKAIFTDLALMDVPSDPNVPNSFTVENGTMHLNAASYGKPDYTFVCKK